VVKIIAFLELKQKLTFFKDLYVWHLQRSNSDLILLMLGKMVTVQIHWVNISDIIKTVWQIM